jgi:hypothetical protein
VYFDDA